METEAEDHRPYQQLLFSWSSWLFNFKFNLYTLHPFWIQASYFLFNSILGFLALKIIGQKPHMPGVSNLDLFFTSTSAATVSSMSTVNMEVLSNGQIVVLTFLMFVGGEIFFSVLQLHLLKTNFSREEKELANVDKQREIIAGSGSSQSSEDTMISIYYPTDYDDNHNLQLKKRSLTMLTLVILGYLAVAHIYCFFATFFYLTFFDTTTRDVLKTKGMQTTLFSTFMAVSSFSNCGFVPTNEGMIPFKNDSGFLLLIIPVLLAGNTLFPVCLRSSLWLLKKISRRGTTRAQDLEYLTGNKAQELRLHHLMPKKNCVYLTFTVLGFVLFQSLFFCSLEWNSNFMEEMNAVQKMAAVLFQSVNTRHAGESLFCLNGMSSAVLVLYIFMMYLPPYTTFLPDEDGFPNTSTKDDRKMLHKKLKRVRKEVAMSQLSYLIFFIILICVTEREKLSKDPLNFNILSITLEVISAYANVGFTMGYSCGMQLQPDANCKDQWYGFAGKWSTKGKLVLIFVMFLGKLQKFNRKGGRAWKLC